MGISRHIELRHLRSLVVLAEELNFRRAAERLNMTQPPLSRALAQLEELVGGRLFDRDKAHCALTPLGAEVTADAIRLLAGLDTAATRWAGLLEAPEPDLRVGLFFALNPRHFRVIEQECQARLPDHRLELIVGRTHDLLHQLRRRRIGAALVLLPAPADGLPVVPVLHTEMVALLPASSPLAARRRVRVADLEGAGPLLFMHERDNPPLYRYLDDALRSRGLERPRYRVPRDTFSGLADIAAGRACTVVCRTMTDTARRDLAFRALHPGDRIPATVGLVHDPALAPKVVEALCFAVEAYARKVFARAGAGRAG